jgi:hypothetical protein
VGTVGALLLASSLGLTLVGCSKKKSEDTKAKAEKPEADATKKKPQGDRFADGQKLDAALKDWTKRWAEQADLPACDPLVKEAATLELCKTAAASLTTLKAAVAKPEPPAALIHAAAELALATENASEKLRLASMEKMQAEHKLSPVSSGRSLSKLPPGAMSAMAKPRAMPSSFASAGKPGDKGKPGEPPPPLDPSMQVMQSYSRVNRASLRYLSQFLQFGALPVRKLAFGELEALSKRKETWPALSRTLREAAMAENDPELLGKLKALAPKLSRRTPTTGLAEPQPGGHQAPAPAAAAPAAPAASE